MPLALVVGRATGSFSEASPTPYASTVPSNVTSHTAAYRVEIAAAPAGTAQARTARFFQGPIPLGSELGFSLGPAPTLGGARLLRRPRRRRARPRRRPLGGTSRIAVAERSSASSTWPASRWSCARSAPTCRRRLPKPRDSLRAIFFSPDCSIALVAGVNRLASPNHLLQLVDLTTGDRLGSVVGFNTTQFAAEVKSVGMAQQLEVTVDAGTATARTIAVALP